jgi:hypothetical protein
MIEAVITPAIIAASVPSAEAVTPAQAGAPPHVQLIEMAVAIWPARAIYAAAQFGLADLLAEGPRSSEELAQATGMHAPSQHRLLPALAGCGVLTETEPRTFATTALGDALRTNAPGAARATVLTLPATGNGRPGSIFSTACERESLASARRSARTCFRTCAKTPSMARASTKPWSACTARWAKP